MSTDNSPKERDSGDSASELQISPEIKPEQVNAKTSRTSKICLIVAIMCIIFIGVNGSTQQPVTSDLKDPRQYVFPVYCPINKVNPDETFSADEPNNDLRYLTEQFRPKAQDANSGVDLYVISAEMSKNSSNNSIIQYCGYVREWKEASC